MIFSVSGRMGSGKDTVGAALQYLTSSDHSRDCIKRLRAGLTIEGYCTGEYKIKKFANKLKDITCMLIGCTRWQLEDQKFKETPIGPDWNKWVLFYTDKYSLEGYTKTFLNEGEAEDYIETQNCVYTVDIEKVELTPRLLLQLLGTDCGRNIIHQNIWVNSLMSEYVQGKEYQVGTTPEDLKWVDGDFSNWIITDTRFPNELDAVKRNGGITIRVNREVRVPCNNCQGGGCPNCTGYGYFVGPASEQHSSETALDSAKFDYTIENDGTIDELIEKVRAILILENLL